MVSFLLTDNGDKTAPVVAVAVVVVVVGVVVVGVVVEKMDG